MQLQMDQSQPPQPQQQRASSHSKLQDGIATPHEHDVLSGRGNFVNYHAGNEHFRGLVRKHKVAYVACPKPQKGQFSRMIYNEIKEREPPGRFLKQDPKTKLWYEIPEKQALAKTRQALREGAPELLKEITHDGSDDQDDDDEFGGGTHVDPGDAFYSPTPGYGVPPLVVPYGSSNSPQVMPLNAHLSAQQRHHSPPPPPSAATPLMSNAQRSISPKMSSSNPQRGASPHLVNPALGGSPQLANAQSHHGGGSPHGGGGSSSSDPRMAHTQLSMPQLSSHHHIAMQNPSKLSTSMQQLPSLAQPSLSMRAPAARPSTLGSATSTSASGGYPSQIGGGDNAFLNLQSRLAAMYHGNNHNSATSDSFEPTPIDPNMHRLQQQQQQQRYDQAMDRQQQQQQNLLHQHITSHKAERDFSPPQRDLLQVNGRERTIHRDESLRIEKLFTQAANEAASSKPSARRMMGSSEHLSAMSFSIGDLTADTESNLSAVFEDSLRISDDHPGASREQQHRGEHAYHVHHSQQQQQQHPTPNLATSGTTVPQNRMQHNNNSMSHAHMDMSFATLGADRNESTSHFVMSTTTFESFTGVFDDTTDARRDVV